MGGTEDGAGGVAGKITRGTVVEPGRGTPTKRESAKGTGGI